MLQGQVKTEIKALKTELSLVFLALDGYLSIRNRFSAVFRRDLLDQKSEADRPAIISGNLFSHASDVLADALLFDWRN